MTTTRETLANLMTLIDNNATNIKEGEYLAICNLMRDLHQESTQPQPPHPSTIPIPSLTQPVSPAPPSTVGVHVTTTHHNRVNHCDNIIVLINQLANLRQSNTRICLRHKLAVLMILDDDVVNGMDRDGRTMTEWIRNLEAAYHEWHPNTPMNYLRLKYVEYMNGLKRDEIDNLRLQIGQNRAALRATASSREYEHRYGLPDGSVTFLPEPVTSLSHRFVPT